MFKNDCKFGGTLDELLTINPALLGLVGSDGEDDGDREGDQSEDDGKGDKPDGDKTDKGDDKDDEESAEVKDLKRRIANFDEERDRWKQKITAANDRAEAAERELAKLKKDGTSDEDARKQIETLTSDNTQLVETNKELALRIAFFEDNTYRWKNPKTALKLADLSNVEIDDNGKVVGLKSALDKLAQSDSYLIEPEEDPTDGKKKPPAQKTGDKPGDKKSGDKASQDARRTSLMTKYSGLRR